MAQLLADTLFDLACWLEWVHFGCSFLHPLAKDFNRGEAAPQPNSISVISLFSGILTDIRVLITILTKLGMLPWLAKLYYVERDPNLRTAVETVWAPILERLEATPLELLTDDVWSLIVGDFELFRTIENLLPVGTDLFLPSAPPASTSLLQVLTKDNRDWQDPSHAISS